MQIEQRLQRIFDRALRNRSLTDAVVRITANDGQFQWTGSAGALDADAPYFIASTTKLFTTALILQLRAERQLALEDPIADHLGDLDIDGLHVRRGVDASRSLTVRHLLSQTSGLPDYLQDRPSTGPTLMSQLTAGRDASWTIAEVLDWIRDRKPKFAPGAPGKAHYSDSNFQLLGQIVERRTGVGYAEAVRTRIVEPLGLRTTWVYADPDDDRPLPLRYKRAPLVIPRAMVAFAPDGGVVSTAAESMTFVRAFFAGQLFPADMLPELQASFNRVFFPFDYGLGISRFRLPRIFSPFAPIPTLIGHSGQSGAFAFRVTDRDIFFAGTVNQIASPGLSFRLMLQLLNALKGI